MEVEPGCLEELAEQRSRWIRVTSVAQKPKDELLAHRAEVEMGTQLTGATMEQARMTGKQEEGRSTVEQRPTKVDLQGRGSAEESQGRWATVKMREHRAGAEPMG